MGKALDNKVANVLNLNQILEEIENIFKSIKKEYKMSKEEILILLTLWKEGSMTLKQMDEFVHIKSYKRTRTYNDLVEKKWIIKERPQNDERTVIIHFNDKLEGEREHLLNFIIGEINSRKESFQESITAILNL
ncbi:transcriptional regulator, SarA/Rot family [Staphylococcus kloosii]|jgi:MarR family transcriptional regulator|uniref:HTH-type transcriptional regulator rot n=1 Tax=Staphylococcus kloosii TaxID=29384 RepID=A0A151A470_9STAP|nr:MarR family transcriptional regulator [Staphylococcus kloosii]AVQ35902.1 transcriptional regulator [Staphylococcus kloosii]KYH14209.1 repressor [Staphylococcus kloosii]MCD8878934.1 MarR family transcriptional regulator [Staphylococcus kloosii]PNZ02574.1 transcriptional regulator [Staphylococcus kloosii]PTJ75576.1 transcriptional regulator [Staphylococcus kloosii]